MGKPILSREIESEREPLPIMSIIVPIHNEVGNLENLYRRIVLVTEANSIPFELILIDDGSKDGSREVQRKLAEQDYRVKAVHLSRNFGHQIALTAGLDFSSGRVLVMMDGDLQHPPELIPELISRWEQGFDVVNTRRESTEGVGIFKRMSSASFYWLINKISEVPIIPGAADFRLIDRKVANALRDIRERNRFIRGLVNWTGYRSSEIVYRAPARCKGHSSYSFKKMARFALDGVTSFSTLPLQVCSLIGLVVSVLSALYGLEAIYSKLISHQTVEGWTSVIVAVLFLGGVQLLSLGVLGLYIGRVYTEAKARPLYLVEETLTSPGPKSLELHQRSIRTAGLAEVVLSNQH